jgi:hypothetical protein
MPSKTELELPSPEEFSMMVDSCVETEDQFRLKINITSSKNVSGGFVNLFAIFRLLIFFFFFFRFKSNNKSSGAL